jgi:hypothetical protein
MDLVFTLTLAGIDAFIGAGAYNSATGIGAFIEK